MSPALMLILAGAVANAAPALVPPAESAASRSETPASAPPQKIAEDTNVDCHSKDARNIVVCAQRRQDYRPDPTVMEANRQVETYNRSANSVPPPAQAECAAQPTGCGKSLDSLDLVNVAVVVGTMAVRAAKGEDWASALKTGGPDEYQLYQQAKRRHEAEAAQRAAAEVKMKAREAQREAAAANAQ